jgi:hypothetical protein
MRRWVALGVLVVATPVAGASAANLDVTGDSAKIEQLTSPSTMIVIEAATPAPASGPESSGPESTTPAVGP